MTTQQRVKSYLEKYSDARERKYRYLIIYRLVCEIIGKDTFGKDDFKKVAKLILTISREINKLQQDNENLRGNDYSDGKRLAQEKQIELGYTPSYHRDVKTLKELFPNENGTN